MVRALSVSAYSVVALMGCAATYAETYETPAATEMAAYSDVLKAWVDARAGTGEPVHWISEGGIYAYPSGEKLFGMIGFDSSTVIWPENPGEKVIHLTRKTLPIPMP